MNLKKFFAGFAIALLSINFPKVSADEVETFGEEFENKKNQIREVGENVEKNPTAEEIRFEVEDSAEEYKPPTNETPTAEISTPTNETPTVEISTPTNETPTVEISTPTNETPTAEISTPTNETPTAEISTPTNETPTAEISAPTNETSAIEIEIIPDEETSTTNPAGELEKNVEKSTDEFNFNEVFERDDSQNQNSENNFDDLKVNPTAPTNPNVTVTVREPSATSQKEKSEEKSNQKSQKKTKKAAARFIKIAMDDTYDYYLDKKSVSWKKIPYMNEEYMLDVWIRMIERDEDYSSLSGDMSDYMSGESEEVVFARQKGISLDPVDREVLNHRKYILEHYYLRPKTQQIQFISALEVVGHPQNTASERAYDYQNWEYLIPGSIESSIYENVIAITGKGKSDPKGHMTFADMFEEYTRISIR